MSGELDPTQVMAKHGPSFMGKGCSEWCETNPDNPHVDPEIQPWPCLTYRLAEALTAERARLQRVEALRDDWWSRANAYDLGRPAITESLDKANREHARATLRAVADKVDRALSGDTEGDS